MCCVSLNQYFTRITTKIEYQAEINTFLFCCCSIYLSFFTIFLNYIKRRKSVYLTIYQSFFFLIQICIFRLLYNFQSINDKWRINQKFFSFTKKEEAANKKLFIPEYD